MTMAAPAPGPILFVNPNSREDVTWAIRASVAGLVPAHLDFVTMPQNPAFIASAAEIAQCAREVEALGASRPDARAIVIACYAQPGLEALRAAGRCPVVGVQDAAVAAAIAMGGPFGVIALAAPAIARHRRHLEGLGLAGHLAAEVALPPGAGAAPDLPALIDCASQLVDLGARSIILGCAGLGAFRAPLAAATGVPVIDPVLAALGALIAAGLTAN